MLSNHYLCSRISQRIAAPPSLRTLGDEQTLALSGSRTVVRPTAHVLPGSLVLRRLADDVQPGAIA